MRRLAKIIDDTVQEMGPLPEKVERHHRITAVTASVIATRLPLPSSPVENSKEWYIQNCIAPTEAAIGGLVEYINIDAGAIMDITKALWENRYAMLHVPTSPLALKAYTCCMQDVDKIPPVFADAMDFDHSNVSAHAAINHIGQAIEDALPSNNTVG
tara:strand:- start:12537 stop:13007 length:471 start_codon:yes stop_codon:yes gene_type:complete